MIFIKEHIVEHFEVVPTSNLVDVYREKCTENSCIPQKRTLVGWVTDRFPDVVQWCPKYGDAFLYNKTVEKGKIIEILCKKIDHLKSIYAPPSIHMQTFAHVKEHDKYLTKQNKPNNESIRPTAEFWLSFLDMMDILFSFRRSVKTGDWKLHLNTTHKMLPWFIAYNRPNYSRFLSLYWSEMQKLPETHPDIYAQFM